MWQIRFSFHPTSVSPASTICSFFFSFGNIHPLQDCERTYPNSWDKRVSSSSCHTKSRSKNSHIWNTVCQKGKARLSKFSFAEIWSALYLTHRVSCDLAVPLFRDHWMDEDVSGGMSSLLSLPPSLCATTAVWLFCSLLEALLGVSLWEESGVSAPSPLSIQLDSDEERSRTFLWRRAKEKLF